MFFNLSKSSINVLELIFMTESAGVEYKIIFFCTLFSVSSFFLFQYDKRGEETFKVRGKRRRIFDLKIFLMITMLNYKQ